LRPSSGTAHQAALPCALADRGLVRHVDTDQDHSSPPSPPCAAPCRLVELRELLDLTAPGRTHDQHRDALARGHRGDLLPSGESAACESSGSRKNASADRPSDAVRGVFGAAAARASPPPTARHAIANSRERVAIRASAGRHTQHATAIPPPQQAIQSDSIAERCRAKNAASFSWNSIAVRLVDQLVQLAAIEVALDCPAASSTASTIARACSECTIESSSPCPTSTGTRIRRASRAGESAASAIAIAGQLALGRVVQVARAVVVGILEQIDEIGDRAEARRGAEQLGRLRAASSAA
jgi:hypothetical protein